MSFYSPAGAPSSVEADAIAEEVLLSCGGGKVLYAGSGMGPLVRSFLQLGVDAQGVDASRSAVDLANSLAPARFHSGSVLDLPFDAGAFDTVVSMGCLEYLAEKDVAQALKELRRVASRAVYLRIATKREQGGSEPLALKSRGWWEPRLFEAGFRKHPSYYRVNAYEALETDGWQITIVLECMPALALARYPLEALKEERDLHMDMLREAGARSDAHVARYQWAASFVRPGDNVLDAACGLGYGSYLLQTGTMAARTLGIDGSAYAIDYACTNFGSVVPDLEFRGGMLPEALKGIADHSVDVVISFETLEHVEDNISLLAEFHRVLTPAGRIIVSVPNDWSDETGTDPNPFHLHVYTLDRLRGEMAAHFTLEKLVAQSASQHKSGPGRKAWVAAGRSLKEVPPDVKEDLAPDAEWWLAVAMRSPLEGEDIPYRETQFPTFDAPAWNVTTFGRDYRNPWLVRGMVDITHRLQDRTALHELAETVSRKGEPDSPDVGAALCVLAYQLLSSPGTTTEDAVHSLDRQLGAYLNASPKTPHGVRWTISLYFAFGKLWMLVGNFDRAMEAFECCIAQDPDGFSPLLFNRTVEAHLLLGLMSVSSGGKHDAKRHWQAGIEAARRAVTTDWSASLGDPLHPAEFGLPELASILEYASSCAYALAHVDHVDTKPWWWLHPRRDRLSQFAMTTKGLARLEEDLSFRAQELDAYRVQADDYRRQLAEASERMKVSADYSVRLETELGSYRGQTQDYQRQIEHSQLGTHALVGQAERLGKEIEALKAESATYAQNLNLASARGAMLEQELASCAEVVSVQGGQLKEAESRLWSASEYAETLKKELAAYEKQSAAYAAQLVDAEARLRDAFAHAATLQQELASCVKLSAEQGVQLEEAESRSLSASRYADTLKQELAAFVEQSRVYESQVGAAQLSLHEAASYTEILERELLAHQRQAAAYVEQLDAAQAQMVSLVVQAGASQDMLRQLEQDLATSIASMTPLQADVIRLNRQVADAKLELNASLLRCDSLADKLAGVEASLDAQSKQILMQCSKIEGLEGRVGELLQDKVELLRLHAAAEALNAERMASPRFLLRRIWHVALGRVGFVRKSTSK
jgi:2-polyprenyl-3-methyl-5-hydroxy-6-metoxy-1,4-benzoquinol methylase